MPKYLDHHQITQMPPEARQKLMADIRAGRADQFGVKPINVFMAPNEAWCLTEAPSVDAVRQGHEATGFSLGSRDIIEVTSLV